MKTLYVDIGINGHRNNYLSALCDSNAIALIPEKSSSIKSKQIIRDFEYYHDRKVKNYLNWLREVNSIACQEGVDCIHFLCGDEFYRFFGIGIQVIHIPVYVTFHHMLFNPIRNISYRFLFNNIKKGIVHTDFLRCSLQNIGISNVELVNYPVFDSEIIAQNDARNDLNIIVPNGGKCLLALGATNRYKGLDILLEALKKVNNPFHIIIGGEPTDISENQIFGAISTYKENVTLLLKHLNNKEYKQCIAAADIVVLPYRFEFDGASGPMIDGIWNKKVIIGSNHGSMGEIIRNQELGYTFETENVDNLAKVLEFALSESFTFTEKAEIFRGKLSKDFFEKAYYKIHMDKETENGAINNSSY